MLTALVIVLVLVAAVVAFVSARPATFSIARSASIKAPAEAIYPYLDDFHRWTAWSPYETVDPNMTRTYDGPNSGKGAIYGWSGNNKAGEGRMEITEAAAPSKLLIDLAFTRPMKARNVAEFTLRPEGGATEVTWAMHGKNNFMSKLMHSLINIDKMVGSDFEKGLAKLKAAVEA
jgi:hypothetical protein